MNEALVDPLVANLAKSMLARLDTIVPRIAEMLIREIDNYAEQGVESQDLAAGMLHSLSSTFAHLADAGEPLDLSGVTETGRLRALQGVPLPEVLRAYRLAAICLWDEWLLEADRAGSRSQAALMQASPHILGLVERHSTALTIAYRDAVAERMAEADKRRSALVAALLDGPPTGSDTVWEIARMLGLPYQGTFVVVAAESVTAGDPPLPGLDARCQAMDIGSAWRAEPGCEMGVLSCSRRLALESILDAIRTSATGRVGVSPGYDRLDQTHRAARYAQVALESLPKGSRGVRQLDDTPLTEMVMTNLETTRRAVSRILGGVLSLPEDDRTTLLATARAWLEAHGSAAEAARALYCHQNTVRYRMHRLEEYLRGPLDNPEIVAELSMAINAVSTFPTLLEHRPTPHASWGNAFDGP